MAASLVLGRLKGVVGNIAVLGKKPHSMKKK
jgi:hypothetical protein